jgi:hypothetical protein
MHDNQLPRPKVMLSYRIQIVSVGQLSPPNGLCAELYVPIAEGSRPLPQSWCHAQVLLFTCFHCQRLAMTTLII